MTRKHVAKHAAIEEFEAACAELGIEARFTQAMKDYGGMVGWAALLYRAKRGCVVSAKALVEQCLPPAEQTITAKSHTMTAEEAQAALVAQCRALGWTDKQIEDMLTKERGQE